MVVINCGKCGNNRYRIENVTERTRFAKSRSNDLEDIGQGQRSSHAAHLILLIIFTKYGKNPSRTADATERTRFSRSRPNDLENTGQGQRSLYATHPLILVIICVKYGKNPWRTVEFFFQGQGQYSETPHEQPPHEQPPLLWGHIFRHHYIFFTSHLNVNPWWTATPLTWSEASDFGSSHPWRAATQQLLEVASHGIHGWFGCGLTDIHVNHTSGQPWVHRPKACKGDDHT